MNFEEDIKDIKELLKISDQDFAESIGIARSTLNRIINNEHEPNKSTQELIYSFALRKGIHLGLINEEIYKSKEDKNHKILFHGSKEGINGKLSISYSKEKKDFGKGFYLGESYKQAISFVSNYINSSVYIYSLNLKGLKVVEFDVSKDWMILVAYFRGHLEKYKNSKYLNKLLFSIKNIDVIIAPIADNSMYSIINDFIEGSITDEQCINSLSANRLGKQYVILNNLVLTRKITFLKQIYLCEKEKNEYEQSKNKEINIGKSKMILAKRQYAGKGQYIEELLK